MKKIVVLSRIKPAMPWTLVFRVERHQGCVEYYGALSIEHRPICERDDLFTSAIVALVSQSGQAQDELAARESTDHGTVTAHGCRSLG